MPRFRKQLLHRNRLRYSAMGKASQRVQRERRIAEITPEFLMDLQANPPLREGDAIGAIEWRNFLTGKVTRWTVLRGDRVNNFKLRSPDGRASKPHGLAWLLGKIRRVILSR